MKQLLHRITLMATVAMFTFQTFANGYEYNGIHYILDEATKTASVTYTGETPENNSYSGDLELPTKFKVNNEYYRVTSIGEKAFIIWLQGHRLHQHLGTDHTDWFTGIQQ